MVRKAWLSVVLALAALFSLSGCTGQQAPLDDLFPARIGDYLRTDGPTRDAAHDVEVGTYQGLDGSVLLRVKYVGKDQIERALNGLPLSATAVSEDPALGQRKGKFFNYAGQFHAAWGNGDWVFVISAPTEASRIAFLAGYGF